jgi:hypothetical protein
MITGIMIVITQIMIMINRIGHHDHAVRYPPGRGMATGAE